MDVVTLLNDALKNKNYYTINKTNPDPILVAKQYKDTKISLICSLFAYGKASMIVRFLEKIDFAILEESEQEIRKYLQDYYYRFQNNKDVAEFFVTLKRAEGIEDVFLDGYKKNHFVIDGIDKLICYLEKLNNYTSKGYKFLIGSRYKGNPKGSSPYKRWNMFLRWMVRDDDVDFGLWRDVLTKDLIIPLDTHTFGVAKHIGLLDRKVYDLQSAMMLTENLKKFDKNDPIKYDFALYRIGQSGDLSKFVTK